MFYIEKPFPSKQFEADKLVVVMTYKLIPKTDVPYKVLEDTTDTVYVD